LKDGGLHPASWWGDSFLFLRDLQYGSFLFLRDLFDCRRLQLEIVVLDPTQRVITRTAQQLESDATCLLTGLKADFRVTNRLYMNSFKPYFDYYGMVVYEHPHMFFAAME
jgi:hypothetical protein